MSVVPGRPFPVARGVDLAGIRATVVGLGNFSGGVETVRWLARKGARVTVTDLAGPDRLANSLDAISDLDVSLRLGRHERDDFTGADLVVASPAVPPESKYIRIAADAGVPIVTELSLTMGLLTGPVVWVTGTCGKSTTTSLLGSMLLAGGRTCHTGGNIGRALIGVAESASPDDLAVIEVSSFQLEWMARDGIVPDLAVVTNVTPNHLDRHETFDRYVEAKAAALPPSGRVVLNRDDPVSLARLAGRAPDDLYWASTRETVARGAHLLGDRAEFQDGDTVSRLFDLSDIRILGTFNRMNALQAATAAHLIGADTQNARSALREYAGLPHRLEDLGFSAGVRGVNDSKATTPEAAIRAIEALDGRIVLIAGGFERGAELHALAEVIRDRVAAVVLLGESAARVEEAIGAGGPSLRRTETIEAAVATAFEEAGDSGTILLSPGHASWDGFLSYEERGDRFRASFLAGPPGGRDEC